jgi:hypothetical protein
MATDHGMKLLIGLTSSRQDLGAGITMAREQFGRFELPEHFSMGHVQAMQKDFETLASIIGGNPEDVLEVCNAALHNDHAKAKELTGKIGLNEETLRAAQGEAAGAVLGAVVLLVVLGALLESDSPHPPPPPPPPDGGAPDAGPG